MFPAANANLKKRRSAYDSVSQGGVAKPGTGSKRHKPSRSVGEVPVEITPLLFEKLVDMFAIALEIEHMVLNQDAAFEKLDRETLKTRLQTCMEQRRTTEESTAPADGDPSRPTDKQKSMLEQFRKEIGTKKSQEDLKEWFRTFPNGLVGITGTGLGDEEDDDDELGCTPDDDKYSPQYLVNTIVELAETVQTLQQVQNRVEYKNKDVQIVCFSSAERDHFPRLGVTPLPSRITSRVFCDKFREEFVNGGDVLVTNQSAIEELKDLLARIDTKRQRSWNRYSEQASRGIIDELQDCLIFGQILSPPDSIHDKGFNDLEPQIINQKNFHIIPEFVILRRPPKTGKKVTDSPLTLSVDNGTTVTYLSGSTDYMAVSLSQAASKRAAAYSKTQPRSYSGYQKWNVGIANLLTGSSAPTFMIIEAKWPGAGLDAHIPQVVAEALGLYLRTQRRFVPFCLTNSREFIFGVLSAEGDGVQGAENVRAEFWITEYIVLETPIEVLLILSALFYWASQNGEKCWKLFAREAKRILGRT